MPEKISSKKIPKELQPILWSVNVKNLDLKKDKIYIIHQILTYGRWEDIKWLFHIYPKEIIKEVFISYPQKIYTPSAFNFVKNILLEINRKLPVYKYDKNFPRHIRR